MKLNRFVALICNVNLHVIYWMFIVALLCGFGATFHAWRSAEAVLTAQMVGSFEAYMSAGTAHLDLAICAEKLNICVDTCRRINTSTEL